MALLNSLGGRKPWWLLVLIAMVGFGYVQEDTKIKLNHYISIGDRYADFYDYGHEACEREDACMAEKRKEWWESYAPMCRTNVAYTRDTFEVFHHWDGDQMLRAKWGLMVAIVLGFFVLDALFLRAVGVADRWKLLLLIYAASGLVVALFWALDGRGGAEDPGYNVAREVLGFLQSPLPSLMLVLLPWLRDRALVNAQGAEA